MQQWIFTCTQVTHNVDYKNKRIMQKPEENHTTMISGGVHYNMGLAFYVKRYDFIWIKLFWMDKKSKINSAQVD